MAKKTKSEAGDDVRARTVLRELKGKRRLRQLSGAIHWLLMLTAFLLALLPGASEACLLLGCVLTVWRLRVDPERKFRRLPFDIPALIFAGFGLASIPGSPDPAFSFYNYYNLVCVYLLMYFFIGQNIRTLADVKSLLVALLLGSIGCLLYGFYQFAFGIETSDMKWVDGNAFPELKKRIFSTWENPNIFAGYLDVALSLALGFFVKMRARGQRILLGLFMLALAACLALTYARGACLTIAIVFLLYGVLKDWRVLVGCIVVGGAILLFDQTLLERLLSVFTKMDTSSEMRLAFWESTLAMIEDHPFLGIGWGAYYLVYPLYDFYMQGAAGTTITIVHAHNMYLNYAAEIGILGALAFCWFFFGTLVTALRTRFLSQEELEQQAAAKREALPTDLSADNALDEELKQVHEGLKENAPQHWTWQDFRAEVSTWDGQQLLSGLSLGIGLAFLSIALNGLTDDLLFNIPSSMLMWLLAALAGVLALASREQEAALGKGGKPDDK